MSVNVSMNMTMHGSMYGDQIPWNPQPNVLCPPPFPSPYPSYSNFPSEFRSSQLNHNADDIAPDESDTNNNNNAHDITGEAILEPEKNSPSPQPLPMMENKSFFQASSRHETLRESPNNYEVKKKLFCMILRRCSDILLI